MAETSRRVIRIQALTLVWMSVEAVVSLGVAWRARSPALLGFGGDSAVELLSAALCLLRIVCICKVWEHLARVRSFSRLTTPQLSALLCGSACFAHWHVDAVDRAAVAHL